MFHYLSKRKYKSEGRQKGIPLAGWRSGIALGSQLKGRRIETSLCYIFISICIFPSPSIIASYVLLLLVWGQQKQPQFKQLTLSSNYRYTPMMAKLANKNVAQMHEDQLNIYAAQSRLYHFPDINLLGKEFNNVNEINNKLDILLKNHNIVDSKNKIQKTLVTRQIEGGFLFKCKVRGCLAFLKFNFTSQAKLILTKSDIEHQHKLNNRMSKGRLPKIKNSEVEECYDELQLLNFRPGQILNFIRIRFKISKPQYYAIKYGRNKRESIKNLLMTLSKYDHFYFECKDLQQLAAYYRNERLKPQKRQDRDVVIVVSRKMKQLYQQYHGQYVLFSIFPELVLETRYSKKLKYHHVGVLYGEDATGSVNLLFGVIFMRKSIRLAYLYIMEKLFNFLGKYPKVLITDYEPHLAQAIRRLQKRIINPQNTIKLHLQLPNSFITNSFQSRTSPQFLSILSNDLEGLLRQSDRNKHQQRLKVILKACQLNPPMYQQKIAEQIRRYVKGNSIIYLPPLFIGLSVTPYSTAHHLRSRVLDFFKSPRPMVLAIKAFFEIFQAYPVLKYLTKQQIEARLNPPKQCSSRKEKLQLLSIISKTYESSTRLKSISKSLSQSAALSFQDSLQKCLTGQLQLVTVSSHVAYRVIQSEQSYPYLICREYQLRYNQKVKVWRCNCHYYGKTGLPCWHQIKVCLQEKSSLVVQINPFWLKDSRFHERRANRNLIEHDIKFWNDGQLKLGIQERDHQKLQNPFPQQNNNKEPNQQNIQVQHQNELYNVKINNNNNEDDDNDSINENEHQGIGALINQLQGIQWKQNDENQSSLFNTWKDQFSSKHSAQQSKKNYQFQDYDRNNHFDSQSINNSFYGKSTISNKQSIKPHSNANSKFTNNQKLKNLKANNHSNSNHNSSNNSSKYQFLDIDLDELDLKKDKDYMSQSSRIWGDEQSNLDMHLSQSYYDQNKSYTSKNQQNDYQWAEGIFEEDDDEVDNESADSKQFVEDNNSQQNSEEQWQMKSLDKINNKTINSIKQGENDLIDIEDGDLNFELDQQQEQYVEFNKDYCQTNNRRK